MSYSFTEISEAVVAELVRLLKEEKLKNHVLIDGGSPVGHVGKTYLVYAKVLKNGLHHRSPLEICLVNESDKAYILLSYNGKMPLYSISLSDPNFFEELIKTYVYYANKLEYCSFN